VQRLYRRIMAGLLDDIVGGARRLPTLDAIAGRYACGHQAAREALRALEERRVIEVRAGHGQRVLERDRWDLLDRDVAAAVLLRHRDVRLLRDAIEALTVVELQAAMLAARRALDGDLALLEGTLERMRDGDGTAERDFHRALVLVSNNAWLAAMLENLHPPLVELRGRRGPAVVRPHETIMAALWARDAAASAAAIEGYGRHLRAALL
jgi:DNA-binding FadR family transcriptional regulator